MTDEGPALPRSSEGPFTQGGGAPDGGKFSSLEAFLQRAPGIEKQAERQGEAQEEEESFGPSPKGRILLDGDSMEDHVPEEESQDDRGDKKQNPVAPGPERSTESTVHPGGYSDEA
jgi:hypothetical protein